MKLQYHACASSLGGCQNQMSDFKHNLNNLINKILAQIKTSKKKKNSLTVLEKYILPLTLNWNTACVFFTNSGVIFFPMTVNNSGISPLCSLCNFYCIL